MSRLFDAIAGKARGFQRRLARQRGSAADRALRAAAAREPYVYDRERYVHHYMEVRTPSSSTFSVNHLDHGPVVEAAAPLAPAPHVIHTFWTGFTPMSPTRRRNLDALQAMNPEAELVVITPENLDRILVPDHPLPPGYAGLSEMHRSDYLRSYTMLFHGGIYCDVKAMTAPWGPTVERLNADPELWAAGPEEITAEHASPVTGPLGDDQRRRYFEIPSQMGFAFKPGSPLAQEWFDEVQRRMRYFEDLLERHPAASPHDSSADYPVPWADLHGHVLSPLLLKYRPHVIADPDLRFDISAYR
ncbi:hypothetical protein Bequi_07630 [Brachybacterium sp. JHP9]|uniref:Capsular polysaccharide synthesis protein n=1 Tax=Brachybacterium equifaecis TaxID=2910770 RepID=A0ABT0R018_9MICO|nr:hypothetical protein [Brachybacterium equifaecis]MCL6423255.1 hypothetical protein [Brachybacterium equifaecis]